MICWVHFWLVCQSAGTFSITPIFPIFSHCPVVVWSVCWGQGIPHPQQKPDKPLLDELENRDSVSHCFPCTNLLSGQPKRAGAALTQSSHVVVWPTAHQCCLCEKRSSLKCCTRARMECCFHKCPRYWGWHSLSISSKPKVSSMSNTVWLGVLYKSFRKGSFYLLVPLRVPFPILRLLKGLDPKDCLRHSCHFKSHSTLSAHPKFVSKLLNAFHSSWSPLDVFHSDDDKYAANCRI